MVLSFILRPKQPKSVIRKNILQKHARKFLYPATEHTYEKNRHLESG